MWELYVCVSFQVVKEDSGNYSCGAPKTRPSSIDVFVSPGEKEDMRIIPSIDHRQRLNSKVRLSYLVGLDLHVHLYLLFPFSVC